MKESGLIRLVLASMASLIGILIWAAGTGSIAGFWFLGLLTGILIENISQKQR
jgi:hypothetical protein